MTRTIKLTDTTGETRILHENETVTLENRANALTAHFHLHHDTTGTEPGNTAIGDGFHLPAGLYRFADPTDNPADGNMRLTHKRTGAWMEGDARLFTHTPDGSWHAGHGLPHWHETETTITGHEAASIPPIRTFGTTNIPWLGDKTREEAGELAEASDAYAAAPSDENRTRMLDELADLLQTVANLCHATHVNEYDIARALDRCWDKNMRREHEDGGRDADGIPIHPNETVRVVADGRTGVVRPSDSWLDTTSGSRLVRVTFRPQEGGPLTQSFDPTELSHVITVTGRE